jgi:hypothetical protein
MCLGARKPHPRLDLRVGKQGSEGSEKGAMRSLRNALSYGVRVRPLSSGTPTSLGHAYSSAEDAVVSIGMQSRPN